MDKKAIVVAVISGIIVAMLSEEIPRFIAENELIAPETSKILLSSFIDVAGVLIGLWGIILVYSLASLDTSSNNLINLMQQRFFEISKLQIRMIEKPKQKEALEELAILNSKTIRLLGDLHENTMQATRSISYWGILVIGCFVATILLSIVGFGKIEDNGLFYWYITTPLATMLFGICSVFLGILSMIPRRIESHEGAHALPVRARRTI